MGTVYRKTFTKPFPAGAEVVIRRGEQMALWKDSRGRTRKARLTTGKNGQERIAIESPYYIAKYRDGNGIVRVVATGCRDETAARQLLAGWEREAERIRSGVITPAERQTAQFQSLLLVDHLEAFTSFQKAKNCHPNRISGDRYRVECVATALGWTHLADLDGEALTRWLGVQRASKELTPANSNEYRRSLVGFANWCRRTGRMFGDPLGHVPMVPADPERKPRALTPNELRRLLCVARLRPLAEYGRTSVKRKPDEQPGATHSRRTWTKAPLTLETLTLAAEKGKAALAKRPDFVNQLNLLGRERALIYKALVLSGLRKGELASLTIAQVLVDSDPAYFELKATDEKNREGNIIPIRADLAADLRHWLANKLEQFQVDTRAKGDLIPLRLPANTPLFNVPAGLLRILNRDAAVAGIPKRDERGRAVCLHGLRHTFGSLLSCGGVAPRVAQELMRHGSLELTMGCYTDPRLLDTAGALDALPSLPLEGSEWQVARATGTTDGPRGPALLAPLLAPTSFNQGQITSAAVNGSNEGEMTTLDASASAVNRKAHLTTAFKLEPRGIEPLTSALRTLRSPS
jgi:integrase